MGLFQHHHCGTHTLPNSVLATLVFPLYVPPPPYRPPPSFMMYHMGILPPPSTINGINGSPTIYIMITIFLTNYLLNTHYDQTLLLMLKFIDRHIHPFSKDVEDGEL